MSISHTSLKARLDAAHAKRAKGEGGFTLIELLVVVVIIGILVAIAIPLYLNYRQGASNKATESDVRGAVSAVEQCYANNNNAYPTADVTGTKGNAITLACTGGDQKATASDNTILTYKLNSASSYTITGSNGTKLYTYNNTDGKIAETAAPAAG